MKSIHLSLLLSLPLSAWAGNLKLDDFKGQYARLTDNKKCLEKIVIDVYENRLRVYDLSSGAHVLSREIHNEKVRMGEMLIEGSIEDKVLTERRYELKRALGLNLSKKEISVVKVFRNQDSVQIEDGKLTCHFAVDLPEVIPPVSGEDRPVVTPIPKPEVEQDEIIIDITKPASEKYVDLKEEFKDGNELLDVSRADEILKRILKIKSATLKYHNDLHSLIVKKESLSAEEIILALKLPYFSSKQLKEIQDKIKEVSSAEEVDSKLLHVLTQNQHVARLFGGSMNNVLAHEIDKKVEEISKAELKLILKEAFKGNAEVLIYELLKKVKDLSLEDKKELIPAIEELESYNAAARLAVEIIREEIKNFSTDELLSNSLSLKDETLVKVVEALGKDVSDPSLENFFKIAEVLKESRSGLATIANAFLIKIPVTAPQDILSMASKLTNGYYDYEAYKDSFLLAASAQVKPLLVSDADQMLKAMGYEGTKAQLFDKLIGKLTEELTVDSFEKLVTNVKNGYYEYEQRRDTALLNHYNKISQTEAQDNLKLLDLLNSHASRSSLALRMFERDNTKTLADLVALSLKVNNGYYDYQDYRDQVLTKGVKALAALTVAEMKLLLDTLSSDGKRLNELRTNGSKLPTLSVTDSQLLVSRIQNGYYDYQNYKDQGLLIVLPKTIIGNQSDITSMMAVSKSTETKRSVLAVGLKLKLAVEDLKTLVSKEADSTLKLEMIKGFTPKITPVSARDLVDLISTVKNGSYEYQQIKFDALNFLLGQVKLSQVSELKLVMEQRTEATNRVEIYKKLKAQLGPVTAANLLVVADLITNGYYEYQQYKDDLILAESKLITTLTKEELLQLTEKVAGSQNDRTLITTMASKLPGFSDKDLSELLVKIQNGYYDYQKHRDETAVSLSGIVKSVSVDGIKSVIGTLEGHDKRKQVALILLAKLASVTKEDVLSISENINNGYYDYQAYKTQFLAEAAKLIK